MARCRGQGFTDFRLAWLSGVAWVSAALFLVIQPPAGVALGIAGVCIVCGSAVCFWDGRGRGMHGRGENVEDLCTWDGRVSRAEGNVATPGREAGAGFLGGRAGGVDCGAQSQGRQADFRLTCALVLVVVGAVGVRCGVELWHSAAQLKAELQSHTRVECVVYVDSLPVQTAFGSWRVGGVLHECGGVSPLVGQARVVLTGSAVSTFVRGEVVQVRGRFRLLKPERLGVVGALNVMGVNQRGSRSFATDFPSVIRTYTTYVLAESSRETQALVRGMGLGDRGALSQEDSQALQAASLSHLVAVSGLHTGIVVGALGMIFPGRGLFKVGGTSALLMLVLMLMGPSASVVRACVMAAVGIFSLWRGQGGQSGPGLGVAVLLMVVWQPWNAVSLGFVFSVMATAGVIWPAQWCRAVLKKALNVCTLPGFVQHLLLAVGSTLCVSGCAQVALIPVLVAQGMPVPVWGVVANVLVTPVIVPLCLGSLSIAVFSVVWPAFAQVLAWCMEPLCQWVFYVARTVG